MVSVYYDVLRNQFIARQQGYYYTQAMTQQSKHK